MADTERKRLGFCYIARRPQCGRASAMCWDDPGREKQTAAFVAKCIKRGDTVERMERFAGDEWPAVTCRSHEPCACRDAQHEKALDAAMALAGTGGASHG